MDDKKVYIEKKEFSIKEYSFFVLVAEVKTHQSMIAVLGVKNKKKYDLIVKFTYKTAEIPDISVPINSVLKEVKETYDINVNRCCIGAAGPVSRKRGYIKLTNIDLTISQTEILSKTMLNKVILLNDFEAIGYGLDLLEFEKDVKELSHIGEDLTRNWTPGNTYAVIGPGYGLGMSISYYDTNRHLHIPLPSEGGHIDFAPYNHLELELTEYLKQKALTKKEVHPEFERVLCYSGISLIFEFLRSKYKHDCPITKQLESLEEYEKVKLIFAYYKKDELCKKTVDMFINLYARASRILALISECYSGLFLAGSLPRENIDLFTNGRFMEEFEKHDKRNDVLRKTKVYIIKNEDIGLLGCCNVAANFYNIE